MKILLLSPPQQNIYGRFGPPYAPLGLLQIGACLRAAVHDVEFLDMALYPGEFRARLKSFRPEMVCITSVTPTFPSALEIARVVKSESSAHVVFGGPHVSILPEEPLKTGKVDFVVVGEGEETVVELAQAIRGGDPCQVTGLCMRSNGETFLTGRRRPIEKLDTLPFPDWTLIRHIGAYAPPEAYSRRVFTIMTSRGCPFDCSFCVSSKLFGKKIRRRSVQNVLAEMVSLVRNQEAAEIHFADDCFTSNRKWVLDFCDAVEREKLRINLSFMNGLRADEVDEEVLAALKNAGVRTVGFGVETGNKSLMEKSGKRLSLDAVEKAFEISRKMGLNTWGFFIIGFPKETRKQALATFALARRLDPDFAKFFPLVPYPGSEVFEEMEDAGLLGCHDWASYGLYSGYVPTLSQMSSTEVADLVRTFYKKFYLRPRKFFLRLLRVRSVVELWLNLRMVLFLGRRFVGKEA
ncbi:radical SAM protein [candidate division TA06 bacterium]|uniref:Radical SAM protein n=1 Tax=candidate division TA06 bacterium TaxID=2250710 RepID=A0A523URG5_UNCT6|nr:MAG: radical SAM protein [candidate division TA06 bacterium]